MGNVEGKLKFASGAFSRGQVQREFEKMDGKTRWYFQDGACCFGRSCLLYMFCRVQGCIEFSVKAETKLKPTA